MNKTTKWEKLEPLPGHGNPCLHCPPIVSKLKMYRRIAVGFGFAAITKDGEIIWTENGEEFHECPTVMKAENMARKDPDHDWRIVLDGPLHGETYQRQDRNEWVLVEKNVGFA